MRDLDYKYRFILVAIGVLFSVSSLILSYNQPGLMHHDIITALFGFFLSGSSYMFFVFVALVFMGKLDI